MPTLSERTKNLTCPVTNCSKTNLLTKSGDRDDRCKYYTKTTVTKDTVELCATETYQKYESNNKYQGFSYNETSKECNLFDKCYKNGRVNSQSISSLKQDSDNSNIKHYRLKEAIEDEPYINSFKSVTSDNCNYEGVKIYSEGIIQSIDSCSEKCYNNEVTNGQKCDGFSFDDTNDVCRLFTKCYNSTKRRYSKIPTNTSDSFYRKNGSDTEEPIMRSFEIEEDYLAPFDTIIPNNTRGCHYKEKKNKITNNKEECANYCIEEHNKDNTFKCDAFAYNKSKKECHIFSKCLLDSDYYDSYGGINNDSSINGIFKDNNFEYYRELSSIEKFRNY